MTMQQHRVGMARRLQLGAPRRRSTGSIGGRPFSAQ